MPFMELQDILDNSITYVEVLKKLGYDGYNGNHRTLKKRLESEPFNLDKFNENHNTWRRQQVIKEQMDLSEILIENSTFSRRSLKKRIIDENLIEYKCAGECGLTDIWNGKPIVLQLEHKNGVNNDNRLENLCFLCPNCHSQTETYGGKNSSMKVDDIPCRVCGEPTKGYSDICVVCNGIEHRTYEVSKEELEKLIQEMPMTKIGKMFGVSDNAIRKRCAALGIAVPKGMRGKWLKGITNPITRKFSITKEELERLYIIENKSQTEIASIYDVGLSTVRKRIKKLGISK